MRKMLIRALTLLGFGLWFGSQLLGSPHTPKAEASFGIASSGTLLKN
jgi:hypothetical protein